jgi:F-type H+-transporting ATPase subunit epsilon
MSTFHVAVITPEGTAYESEAQGVVAPGVAGSFGVLANHAPMIAALRKGVLRVQCPEREDFLAVGEGLLEVSGQGVLVLAEWASGHVGLRDAQQKIIEREKSSSRIVVSRALDTRAGGSPVPADSAATR